MIAFKALDPAFPIDRQFDVEAAPVVLVNLFTIDPDDKNDLLGAWRIDALWLKRQRGFISTQLHEAVGESSTYLNYAVWDSVADFRAAFSNPEFQHTLSHYPSSAVAAPHLFQKIAVPGCCTR